MRAGGYFLVTLNQSAVEGDALLLSSLPSELLSKQWEGQKGVPEAGSPFASRRLDGWPPEGSRLEVNSATLWDSLLMSAQNSFSEPLVNCP